VIRFSHVCKNFGPRRVLDDLDFEIAKGETFVVVGPSGAGKSVTIRHMVRLLTPDSGRIFVDGTCITEAHGKALAAALHKFGVLFQSGALLQWLSVLDNVCLPLRQKTHLKEDEILRIAREKLALVGLSDAENLLPANISGGMRKRAGLARAIATEPEIVLYDEPTSGLDPIGSRQIDRLIDSLRVRLSVTSVVVTHDLYSALGIGTRIALLHQGRFVTCDPPEQFIRSPHPAAQSFLRAQGIDSMDDVRKAFER
jgi:phospholipid/cholesterol/gamma-HCH transport system ATP-binding protein